MLKYSKKFSVVQFSEETLTHIALAWTFLLCGIGFVPSAEQSCEEVKEDEGVSVIVKADLR